jgi:hypothetical protein
MNLQAFISTYSGQTIGSGQLSIPEPLFGFYASDCRLIRGFEAAQIHLLIIYFNLSNPSIFRCIPPYTSHARSIIWAQPTISQVGTILDDPEVRLSIIKSIATNMVNIHSFRSVCDKTMKIYNTFRSTFLNIILSSLYSDTPFAIAIAKILSYYEIPIVQQAVQLSIFPAVYPKTFHISTLYQVTTP